MIEWCEEEVEKFNEYFRVVFTNIYPSVVLSSFAIPALPIKIVSQPKSPNYHKSSHNNLSERNRYMKAIYLIKNKMHCETNWEKRPYSINPWIIFSYFTKYEDNYSYMEKNDCSVRVCTCLTIFTIAEVLDIIEKIYDWSHYYFYITSYINMDL